MSCSKLPPAPTWCGPSVVVRYDPAPAVAMIEVFLAADPATEHRARKPPFLRPKRKINMDHDEGDHRHRGKAVDGIDHAPGFGRKPIGIASPERRIDLEQH